uniref:Uncharacterized protein n=1 Tax=Anguilla anguilla TaxID=7936 RepID=A0A0E9Q3U1_ANGAN
MFEVISPVAHNGHRSLPRGNKCQRVHKQFCAVSVPLLSNLKDDDPNLLEKTVFVCVRVCARVCNYRMNFFFNK